MQIDVKDNLPQVLRAMSESPKQATFALAVSLTRTAQDVREAERAEMRDVFDRPTGYTLNGLYVKTATKADLTARVWFKNGYGTKPHYLEPQVHGGARPLKRFEELMVRAGYMRRNERAVPGEGVGLDAFGNISRGHVQKILSQLHAFYLAGASQNATKSRRSSAKRMQQAYFVSDGKGSTKYRSTATRSAWKNGGKEQHLPRGIWQRTHFGHGTAIKPVILFVPRATYEQRFDFFGVARRVVGERLPAHFAREWPRAMATARPASSGRDA